MFYSRQRGSALVVSLFIITVMGAFAAAMIRIDWSGQDTTAREVFATRAWYAAHSGNDIVLSKLFPLGKTVSEPLACEQTYDFNKDAELFSCQKLQVICKTYSYKENGQPANKYQLESTATCGSGQFSTTRTQEVWAKDLEIALP
ncbi:MshP protein [Photobacterium sp. DNB23_23_1]|uniref:MshP protein n=1 Tax=Photobacterium pectinilyticum TaxID=2906793 RepID=A0ABT1MXD9_9GAMM|nr:MshP protein [Photobacterium sp. ZSDE20]MCQ1057135.1 MshP protein [Photobacterium sp. ZSDE20]MDD1821270.1 MshP protein [Photobacterium sp. ZSDE20]